MHLLHFKTINDCEQKIMLIFRVPIKLTYLEPTIPIKSAISRTNHPQNRPSLSAAISRSIRSQNRTSLEQTCVELAIPISCQLKNRTSLSAAISRSIRPQNRPSLEQTCLELAIPISCQVQNQPSLEPIKTIPRTDHAQNQQSLEHHSCLESIIFKICNM